MADPFQIAASAIAVAEFIFKTCESLAKFVKDAKASDNTVAEIRDKVQRLGDVVLSIKDALVYRTTQVATKPPEPEEALIWDRIWATLDRCQRTLKRFKEELKDLHGRGQFEWVRKTLLQLRLQQKDPMITRFEKRMDTYMQVLQTLFICLQAFVQGDIANLSIALREISLFAAEKREEVDQLRQERLFDQNGDTRLDARTEDYESETLRKTIRAARTVMDKVSDRGSDYWSMPETETEMDSDDERLKTTDGTTFEDLGKDPDPDFNDFTALEVLEPLIDNFEKRVDKDMVSGNYSEAEKGQLRRIKYLKEREAGYDLSFDKAAEHEKLADIYYKQEKFDDGNRIIQTLLTRGVTPEGMTSSSGEEEVRKSRLLYTLANSKYMQSHFNGEPALLEASEKFAKQSFRLRLAVRDKENQAFIQSVQLLIDIYREQGNSVEVKTYSDLYLNNNLTPLASLPSALSPSNAPSTESQQTSSPSIRTVSFDQDPSVIISNNREVLRLRQLLNDVADVKDGKTLLMRAVECSHEGAVRSLLAMGVQIDDTDKDGQTALHQAIKTGNLEMTELLLERGASIEGQDSTKATPLICAVKSGHESIVRLLLSRGSDISAKDKEDWTCLHHAVHRPGWDNTRIIQQLVQARADVNARCRTQETPLHMAVKLGKRAVAEILLDRGAGLHDQDGAGDTPFHIAVSAGHHTLVDLLLDRGATYDRTNLPEMSRRMKNFLKAKEKRRYIHITLVKVILSRLITLILIAAFPLTMTTTQFSYAGKPIGRRRNKIKFNWEDMSLR